VAGQSSGVLYFDYLPPTVASVSPATASTAGGLNLLVVGSNFGQSGNVTVGGKACVISIYQSSLIQCASPEGYGQNKPVVVYAVDQSSQSAVYFSYSSPVISSVSPSAGPTNGGIAITISGSNFGGVTALANNVISVSFSGISCVVVSATHTQLVCTLPAGTGTGVSIRVTVDGQISAAVSGFSYSPPSIFSVSGCPLQDGNTTLDCSVSGGTVLTITGANFGTPSLQMMQSWSPAVTVNNIACSSANITVAHSELKCNLPSSKGFNLAVSVVINQQSTSQPLLSYTGPVIFPLTLVISGNSFVTPTVIPSTSGGQLLHFGGKNFGSNASAVYVTYGEMSDPSRYSCQVNTAMTTSTDVYCYAAAGVGQFLFFTVSVFNPLPGVGFQQSLPGTDSLRYPQPLIQTATLDFGGGSNGTTLLQGTETAGQTIQFRALNLGSNAALLSISYGISGSGSYDQVCSAITLSGTIVTCLMSALARNAAVGPYSFVISALNQQSPEGSDQYNYPTAPQVYSVTGCPFQSGNVTTQCPTTGGVTITLNGAQFAQIDTTVTVGGVACSNYIFFSVSLATCRLPSGTGLLRTIIVAVGSLFSAGDLLVSYSVPSITSVSGCTDSYPTTLSCPRTGGTIITLVGAMFGSSGATVIVGGISATNVTHDSLQPHSKLTFTLPTSFGLARSIFLLQKGGEISQNAVTLSYLPCPPGTHEDLNSAVCISCAPGSYSAASGLLQCINCSSGTFNNVTGATFCLQCALGRYALALSGALGCADCPPGTQNDATSQVSCSQCAAGKYSSSYATASCLSCPVGRFSSLAGQSVCSACPPGQFNPLTGAVACTLCLEGTFSVANASTSCLACSSGQYQSSVGRTVCVFCAAGTYANVPGQAACQPCASGSFANATGFATCAPCPAGTYSVLTGSVGPTQCAPCSAGSFIDTTGQGTCLLCAQGTYNTASRQSACINCAAGSFNPSIGQTRCQNCLAGAYASNSGSVACSPCPLGSSYCHYYHYYYCCYYNYHCYYLL
jgi:hypothetical protein